MSSCSSLASPLFCKGVEWPERVVLKGVERLVRAVAVRGVAVVNMRADLTFCIH